MEMVFKKLELKAFSSHQFCLETHVLSIWCPL